MDHTKGSTAEGQRDATDGHEKRATATGVAQLRAGHRPAARPLVGLWHASAPRRLRELSSELDDDAGWSAWAHYLARRRRPKPLDRVLPGSVSPLVWALPAGLRDGPSIGMVEQLQRWTRRSGSRDNNPSNLNERLTEWLADAATVPTEPAAAVELLAWCHALPRLARRLAPAVGCRLTMHLLAVAAEAVRSAEVDSANTSETPESSDTAETDGNRDGGGSDRDPLASQLLAVELPLTVAYLFPELAGSHALAELALAALVRNMTEANNTLPVASIGQLPLVWPILASWTRSLTLVQWQQSVERATARHFQKALVSAIRLTRADGSTVLSTDSQRPWHPALLKTARRLVDRPTKRLLQNQLQGKTVKSRSARRWPSPAFHCSALGLSVLRSGWKRQRPRLTVAYDEHPLRVELSDRGRVVWSGPWDFEVRWNGSPLAVDSPWELVWWTSDKKADCLALEVRLEADVRLQRHMLMPRKDRFLLLADVLLSPRSGSLDYVGRLPLANGTMFQPAQETHEGWLVAGKSRSLVFPLTLPEWRAGVPRGSLAQQDQHLELSQSDVGHALCAPLFFALDGGQRAREFTWRQLTIGRERQPLARDEAVGYRVQVDDDQWMIYRSLAAPEIRTVLGQNVKCQFLVGRFTRKGKVKPLVEIE